jgi:hypothetical protein
MTQPFGGDHTLIIVTKISVEHECFKTNVESALSWNGLALPVMLGASPSSP